MKRSEALQKIKEYNNCLDPYDDREFEEQILWFMEYILGMVPPERLNSPEGGWEQTWEPEK